MENMKVQLKEMLENWKKPHWPKIILFISSSLAGFTLILIILEYTRRIGSLILPVHGKFPNRHIKPYLGCPRD